MDKIIIIILCIDESLEGVLMQCVFYCCSIFAGAVFYWSIVVLIFTGKCDIRNRVTIEPYSFLNVE